MAAPGTAAPDARRRRLGACYAGTAARFPAWRPAYPQPSALRAKNGLLTFERQMAETAPFPAPFRRLGPERPTTPVILSVPHAGRAYSDALLRQARLPRMRLG